MSTMNSIGSMNSAMRPSPFGTSSIRSLSSTSPMSSSHSMSHSMSHSSHR
jgi:hypothetical protein